ncbi:hypothetical protein ACFL54_06840 [Planctomycetota bacterium]
MGWKEFVPSVKADMRKAEREEKRRQKELAEKQQEQSRMEELAQAQLEVEVYDNLIDRLISVHKECAYPVDWKAMASVPEKPDAQQDAEADNTDKIESRHIADRILNGDVNAYLEAITELNPFKEIDDLGSTIEFTVHQPEHAEVTVKVHGEDIIPKQSKSLLNSGKLSTKELPIKQYYQLHQDYVCSCVLRVASELFALLPLDRIIITAVDDIANAAGHIEEQPILSITIPRTTFDKLNLDNIDPSDSFSKFKHNMNFKKTKGFATVAKLAP